MTGESDIAAAGWSLAATLALALAAQGWRAGRRRSALNRALHELRRPLQALSLAIAGPRPAAPVATSSLQLAGVAIAHLDREINGGPASAARVPVAVGELIASSVNRWRSRVAMVGGSLRVECMEAVGELYGDPVALAQALDNVIVNAIEHGGPQIVVSARVRGERLAIAVSDSGRSSRPPTRRETPAEAVSRLSGRRRRGHGLSVVRAIVGDHGGRFVLRRCARGSRVVIELPLEARRGRSA